jgi:hypothetical protein
LPFWKSIALTLKFIIKLYLLNLLNNNNNKYFKTKFLKNSQEKFQIMFQICVLEQKISRKGTIVMFLNFLINVMIKNIKIHNITDIIEMSKSIKPNN